MQGSMVIHTSPIMHDMRTPRPLRRPPLCIPSGGRGRASRSEHQLAVRQRLTGVIFQFFVQETAGGVGYVCGWMGGWVFHSRKLASQHPTGSRNPNGVLALPAITHSHPKQQTTKKKKGENPSKSPPSPPPPPPCLFSPSPTYYRKYPTLIPSSLSPRRSLESGSTGTA